MPQGQCLDQQPAQLRVRAPGMVSRRILSPFRKNRSAHGLIPREWEPASRSNEASG